MHDLPDAGGLRLREERARPFDRRLERQPAVIEPDVVRVEEDVYAVERLGHPVRIVEVVREGPDAVAEAVPARVRRQPADVRPVDKPLGDGATNETGGAGDQDDQSAIVQSPWFDR